MTPLPAPIKRPVGPFILSVQPGTGSFQIGITILGLQCETAFYN